MIYFRPKCTSDCFAGFVEQSRAFDTHASSDETKKMLDFLQQISSKPK